jgi:tetratricopeptide (TPR) repeat protein
MVGRFVLVLVVAAVLAVAELAGAEPEQDRPAPEGTPSEEERARALFSEGIAKIRDENWREAESDLRRSYELVPRASTLYNLALVIFKQGRLTESLALASELIRMADSCPRRQAPAKRGGADRAHRAADVGRGGDGCTG